MFKIIATDGATLTVCAEDYHAAAGVHVVWHLETHGTHQLHQSTPPIRNP